MFAAIFALFLLPWLDRSEVKSIRYRLLPYKIALASFVTSFVVLGYLGMVAWGPGEKLLAQTLTGVYFLFFVFIFIYSKNEKHKPIPERLTH